MDLKGKTRKEIFVANLRRFHFLNRSTFVRSHVARHPEYCNECMKIKGNYCQHNQSKFKMHPICWRDCSFFLRETHRQLFREAVTWSGGPPGIQGSFQKHFWEAGHNNNFSYTSLSSPRAYCSQLCYGALIVFFVDPHLTVWRWVEQGIASPLSRGGH